MAFKKKKFTKQELAEHRQSQKERVQKSRQEIVDTFIESLEKGEIPWKKPWIGNGRYVNGASGHIYTGNNVFHLYCAVNRLKKQAEKDGRPFVDDNRFFTVKNLKDLGTRKEYEGKSFEEKPRIRKGEKAIYVEFSKPVRYTALEENDDGMLEMVGKKAFITRLYPVFHASQCENLPPEKERQKFEWDDIERAERIVKALGVKVEYAPSDEAYYSPFHDYIHMPEKTQFKDAEQHYATLLHEEIHATGHSSRLNRKNMNFFGSPDYAREELVAQTGSAMLCASIGIMTEATFENDQAYIQNWIQVLRKEPNELFNAARQAQQAVDFVFEKELEYAKSIGLGKEELDKIQECIRPEPVEKKSKTSLKKDSVKKEDEVTLAM